METFPIVKRKDEKLYSPLDAQRDTPLKQSGSRSFFVAPWVLH